MRNARIYVAVLVLFAMIGMACGASRQVVPGPGADTATPAATSTEMQAPSATATPEPSPTPTQAILPLEVVEWAVYPYADLADPNNTDKRVEILVRNPNDFPVRVNVDAVELRLLNAAGEVVFTNPNPTFYFWEGSWIRGGETLPMTACACFETGGVTTQEWKSLELVAPLEVATGIAYTTDVDVKLGEFKTLMSDELGAELALINTSDLALKSFEVCVTAWDSNGKYVGVAVYGSFVHNDDSGNYVKINPGKSGGGIVVTLINYVNEPLKYEIKAIGIPADP